MSEQTRRHFANASWTSHFHHLHHHHHHHHLGCKADEGQTRGQFATARGSLTCNWNPAVRSCSAPTNNTTHHHRKNPRPCSHPNHSNWHKGIFLYLKQEVKASFQLYQFAENCTKATLPIYINLKLFLSFITKGLKEISFYSTLWLVGLVLHSQGTPFNLLMKPRMFHLQKSQVNVTCHCIVFH